MDVCSLSDVGLVRSHNEDACACGNLPGGAWAVVCDGMGGANAGEVASQTAVEIIARGLVEEYQEGCTDNKIKYLMSFLGYEANAKIYRLAEEQEKLQGMGTTLVMAVVTRGIAHIVYAGDSRAYLLTKEGARQLTTDHSMVQELVDLGDLTPEEAKVHPQKNIITRALGVHAVIDLDYLESHMGEDDRLLLCSDGLTNYVDTDQMYQLSLELDGPAYLQRLVELAKEAGGNDNITAAMIGNGS